MQSTTMTEGDWRTALAQLQRAQKEARQVAEELRASLRRVARPGPEMRRLQTALRIVAMERR